MSRNVRGFMSLFHSEKPVICKVHGYCVAGGTDMALCSDLLVVEDAAKIGYPPARVWGVPTTALWAYRIGPARAKRLLLTGDSIDGTTAVEWGLATEAAPAAELDDAFESLLERVARLPVNQLVMHKLLVNQALYAQGLQATQALGTFFDGIARHTPEGFAFQQPRGREGLQGGGAGARRAVRRLRPGLLEELRDQLLDRPHGPQRVEAERLVDRLHVELRLLGAAAGQPVELGPLSASGPRRSRGASTSLLAFAPGFLSSSATWSLPLDADTAFAGKGFCFAIAFTAAAVRTNAGTSNPKASFIPRSICFGDLRRRRPRRRRRRCPMVRKVATSSKPAPSKHATSSLLAGLARRAEVDRAQEGRVGRPRH